MRVEPEHGNIPRTMSTQHPDNARIPNWCDSEVMDGNTEIQEAYLAYSTLGCREVMWDAEGKDVDTRVVRKLLTNYEEYFKQNVLGEDLFLTYRIPNPRVEAVERKIVVETLQNIPVAYDVASTFYGKNLAPIFEVILPFTTDGAELVWLDRYYKKAIVAAEDLELDGSFKVKDWIGCFNPKGIRIIPLVEDFDSILAIDRIVESYADVAKPDYLRVFLARSDPALNYGLVCAVLLSKIGLSKLGMLQKRRGLRIHPILGVGSTPFRGHLSPENLENFLHEYRGLSTVTIQSALKYDHPVEQTKETIRVLNERLPNEEHAPIEPHEENQLVVLMKKFRHRYENVVEELSPLVNSIAQLVPQRRTRKLHIGLFGYSRSLRGVTLPRAITFAAAFYSLGIPPEFIGGKAFDDIDTEWDILQKHYLNMKSDISRAGAYLSWQNVNMLQEAHAKLAERAGMSAESLRGAIARLLEDIEAIEENVGIKVGPRSLTERKHEDLTNIFLISYMEHEDSEARTALVEAAKLRRCLG